MTPSGRIWRTFFALAGLSPFLLGCVATFDAASYKNAVDLKYETLAMIDKGAGRYAAHRSQAEALAAKLDAAYAESAKIANNQAAEAQWKLIVDPAGSSAGAALQTWKTKGVLTPAYRAEKKRQVARHFDFVICLESSKMTAGTCVDPGSSAAAAQAEAQRSSRTATPQPRPAEPDEPQQPSQAPNSTPN